MKAEEKRFLQFLEWSDRSFMIPVYQRNYDWKKEQCKQLFDDIILITKEDYRTHFMWAIVAYQEDWYWKELLIIDWQQRLTTLSLLLLALYKVLENEDVQSTIIKERIHDEFLVNKYSSDKTKKIRLKPVKDDREAFNWIFEWEWKEGSNVTVNYNYFYNRILELEISIDYLYKAIEQLIIVEVMLKKWEDDPQLIFESLNSTWLDLTEADKVRNYILMKETSDNQERLYKNYWYKIEKNTNYDVSDFLRDYLTFKERKIPTKSKVYLIFKEFIKSNNYDNNIEILLVNLLEFSEYYKIIVNWIDDDSRVSEVLKRINKLETLVSYPFLLELYSKISSKIISKDDLYTILLTIESYVFRRFICWVPTNALNKTFMLLSKDIEAHEWYNEDYLNIFNFVLLNKKWSQRFPNDQEFSDNLLSKDIYNTQSRNKLHLLERLENFDNRESDIQNLIDEWILTIEHIMPQTLTKKWEEDLWNNYEEIHERYLHTLWNITLTWYNSKYSNKTFQEKKNIEKGFNESHLYLNWFIKTIDEWNEKNIIERYTVLKTKALNVWTYPKTTYLIKKDESKVFTLSDEKDFTWEKILEYELNWENYKVSSWTALYEDAIKNLFDKDPVLVYDFINDEHLWTKFKKNIEDLRSWVKIGEGLFLELNQSTEAKLRSLREVMKKFKMNLDNLNLYIK